MTVLTIWSIAKEEFAPYAYISKDNWEDAVIEYADLVGAKIKMVQGSAYTLDNGRIVNCARVHKSKVRRDYREYDLINIEELEYAE